MYWLLLDMYSEILGFGLGRFHIRVFLVLGGSDCYIVIQYDII